MGAWGYGHFENDTALDFTGYLGEVDDLSEIIKNTIDTALDGDYLDQDAGAEVIVCCAIIDNQLNGTEYPAINDLLAGKGLNIELPAITESAAVALQKVLGNNSELYELWAETGEDLGVWMNGVQELMDRLKRS